MNKLLYLLLPLMVFTALLQSCETDRDPCLQPKTTLLRAGAYKRVTDTGTAVIDTALPSPVFTALNDSSQNNSFILLSNRNKFSFQLSDVSDTCRWVLRPDTLSQVRDTLTFYYRRQPRFLSNACGYTFYYNLDSVISTHYAIDSINIPSKDVTSNAGTEHIRIYF